ncbi:MAG TPA: response regulator transcription factor, partial [Chondromyces sp.]|nr:response regulator transcription factor [Chondromyces sp.]
PGELTARIQAVLRRFHKEEVKEDSLTKGPIELQLKSHTVRVHGKVVSLTLKEFELLALLMKNEEQVFSREQLLLSIWGADYTGGTRTVDTHIKTLRMKLGKEAGAYISTVWGVGYKFEDAGL